MSAARIIVDLLARPARRGARHARPASVAATHDFEGSPGEALWPICRQCLEPVWFHKPPDPVPPGARVREVLDPRREPALVPNRSAVSTS